jgi:hypothetical protein
VVIADDALIETFAVLNGKNVETETVFRYVPALQSNDKTPEPLPAGKRHLFGNIIVTLIVSVVTTLFTLYVITGMSVLASWPCYRFVAYLSDRANLLQGLEHVDKGYILTGRCNKRRLLACI